MRLLVLLFIRFSITESAGERDQRQEKREEYFRKKIHGTSMKGYQDN